MRGVSDSGLACYCQQLAVRLDPRDRACRRDVGVAFFRGSRGQADSLDDGFCPALLGTQEDACVVRSSNEDYRPTFRWVRRQVWVHYCSASRASHFGGGGADDSGHCSAFRGTLGDAGRVRSGNED